LGALAKTWANGNPPHRQNASLDMGLTSHRAIACHDLAWHATTWEKGMPQQGIDNPMAWARKAMPRHGLDTGSTRLDMGLTSHRAIASHDLAWHANTWAKGISQQGIDNPMAWARKGMPRHGLDTGSTRLDMGLTSHRAIACHDLAWHANTWAK
jgi:hypothetical protein